MKNKIAKMIGLTSMTLILFIAAARTPVMGQEIESARQVSGSSQSQLLNRIVGVWEITITPRDCITGQQIAPSFQGLSTYNLGGTVAETGGLNPNFPGRTSGHGTWQAAPWNGEDSYLLNFVFMPLTAAGTPAGKQKITQLIEYRRHHDDYTSTGTFQFFTPSGVVAASGCSTAAATRFR